MTLREGVEVVVSEGRIGKERRERSDSEGGREWESEVSCHIQQRLSGREGAQYCRLDTINCLSGNTKTDRQAGRKKGKCIDKKEERKKCKKCRKAGRKEGV